MKGMKSKRREAATLLCSLGAIAIGGIAADAWAAVEINEQENKCWVCIDLPSWQICDFHLAAYRRTCLNACERARCDYNSETGFSSSCQPVSPSVDPNCPGDLGD
ncbi:MAG: hypothetical protein KF684_13310 [Phycisphaeraceae bacterium]|nr:hypothetical protein [Phycisphaeraceae bacterium]